MLIEIFQKNNERIKPILFNTEMVRAILNGRKMVTRRVIKTESGEPLKYGLGFVVAGYKEDIGKYAYGDRAAGESMRYVKPPYKVNDILYVRETWSELSYGYEYKADGKTVDHLGNYIKWRPSIHMPKKAARIFLKVTGVRVEQLQDMTAADCHKEGINIETNAVTDGETLKRQHDFSLERFETLWDSTIKKDQLQYYGWDSNPYVWVIEFEMIKN